jgi:AAA+ superfamily predicted ATPase
MCLLILIKSSLLFGSETWRLTENNKRQAEATEMDVLRRSSRISKKERIRNVTIRKQIGQEETIINKKLNRTSLHGTAMFRKWQKEDCPK